MNEKVPVMLIFNDGTAEQMEPLSIAFMERVVQSLANYTQRLKETAMVAPQNGHVPTQHKQEEAQAAQ